jgi:hypothetical protein
VQNNNLGVNICKLVGEKNGVSKDTKGFSWKKWAQVVKL